MYLAIDAQKRYEVMRLVVSQGCNRCQQNLSTNPHNLDDLEKLDSDNYNPLRVHLY